jgi:hypothetical protein
VWKKLIRRPAVVHELDWKKARSAHWPEIARKRKWNMQPEAADGEGDVSRSSAHLLRINGRDNPIPWENA